MKTMSPWSRVGYGFTLAALSSIFALLLEIPLLFIIIFLLAGLYSNGAIHSVNFHVVTPEFLAYGTNGLVLAGCVWRASNALKWSMSILGWAALFAVILIIGQNIIPILLSIH